MPASQSAPTNGHNSALGGLTGGQLLSVRIVKGPEGFGFTIGDTVGGQRIKKILYPTRCPGMAEGDLFCEINGLDVRNFSHTDIVDALRDCPVGQEAHLLVLRYSNTPTDSNTQSNIPVGELHKTQSFS
jgi:hypothetical protein